MEPIGKFVDFLEIKTNYDSTSNINNSIRVFVCVCVQVLFFCLNGDELMKHTLEVRGSGDNYDLLCITIASWMIVVINILFVDHAMLTWTEEVSIIFDSHS